MALKLLVLIGFGILRRFVEIKADVQVEFDQGISSVLAPQKWCKPRSK